MGGWCSVSPSVECTVFHCNVADDDSDNDDGNDNFILSKTLDEQPGS